MTLSRTVFFRYSASNNGASFESALRQFKVIENGTTGKLGYGFLFAFHRNYSLILYHFRDKAKYWWELNRDFSYLPVHSSAPLENPRRNTAIKFSTEKLECTCGYQRWKTFEDMIIHFDTYTNVTDSTDGRTDRWTDTAQRYRPRFTRQKLL